MQQKKMKTQRKYWLWNEKRLPEKKSAVFQTKHSRISRLVTSAMHFKHVTELLPIAIHYSLSNACHKQTATVERRKNRSAYEMKWDEMGIAGNWLQRAFSDCI